MAWTTHTDFCLCSITYHIVTRAGSINQIGEAYGGLGSCRSDHFDMFAFRCHTHAKQRHILSGRVCATSKAPLRDVGVQQFRHVVFVSVGRVNCLLGLSSMCYSFLSLFRSVLVLVHSVQFI